MAAEAAVGSISELPLPSQSRRHAHPLHHWHVRLCNYALALTTPTLPLGSDSILSGLWPAWRRCRPKLILEGLPAGINFALFLAVAAAMGQNQFNFDVFLAMGLHDGFNSISV